MPYSPADVYLRFEGTYGFQFQCRRVRQPRNQQAASTEIARRNSGRYRPQGNYERFTLACCLLVSYKADCRTLKMEAIHSSKTSVVFFQPTWRYIPKSVLFIVRAGEPRIQYGGNMAQWNLPASSPKLLNRFQLNFVSQFTVYFKTNTYQT
jgi:hypothetical protein